MIKLQVFDQRLNVSSELRKLRYHVNEMEVVRAIRYTFTILLTLIFCFNNNWILT